MRESLHCQGMEVPWEKKRGGRQRREVEPGTGELG